MYLRHSAALALIACLLVGCYEHKVNTYKGWCERLSDINEGNSDPDQAYRPFWAVIYSVRIDRDEIRDDFVKFLNDAYMEKVQKRAPRMVWRVGKVLHVVNLSSLFVVEPGDFLADWKKGIAKAQSLKEMDHADNCLWGTVFQLFDSVQIHSLTHDPPRDYWGDSVTALPTDRKKILAKYFRVEDTDGWYLMVPALVQGPAIYPACQQGLVTNSNASVAQWNIEGSFDSVKECENQRERARESGAAGAAEAAQRLLSSYRKESPREWSLPICSGLARGKQLSQATCVSTDDPRLKEK